MILAGRWGDRKRILAFCDGKRGCSGRAGEQTFASGDLGWWKDAMENFLTPPVQELATVPPDKSSSEPLGSLSPDEPARIEAACFGVAGPVIENRSRTTNLPWVVDGAELAKRFQLPTVRLLNDVEVKAHGVLVLRPDETEVLNAGAPSTAKSAMALIAAGTGLGEAILFWDGARYRPMPSEGGHADFAPTSDVEIDLLRYLRASHMHVSYERVLSGAGLHAVYEFIRDTKKNEPTWLAERLKVGDPAAIIAELGLSGKAEICVQALDLFASVYGAEAGNLALKALALDGVSLGGGIAPKLLAKLKDGTFMRAFVSKGRYKRLMSTIPVRVILNQKTALLGAASVAARLRAEA